MNEFLALGDRVHLIDARHRRYSLTLVEGGVFHSHVGTLAHDELRGLEEGSVVETSLGRSMVAMRPTLAEHVLSMPRGAQVVYPKDLGPILMRADLYPGARVFESGIGSGALTMTLLRAVGPTGSVLAYELREDFANTALANVEAFLGPDQPLTVELRDAYQGIDAEGLDRVVLDLPEPWHLVPHAEGALRGGGIFLSYLPTITQVIQLRAALAGSKLQLADTVEVLERSWQVDGQSVRPDHRMVAHTGFLTTARLTRGDLGPTRPRRRSRTGLR